MDSVEGWQETKQGSPQGAVISPLLSNIYLNGLDWKMAQRGFERLDLSGLGQDKRTILLVLCGILRPFRAVV
jgi:retron-type reverse transcriptase